MDDTEKRARRVRRDFWPKWRRYGRAIPFAEDILATYYAAFDPQTPLRVRATLLGALAYFILPTDAVPDFLAAVGFTDDAAVLWAAIRMAGAHVGERHRAAARETLRDEEADAGGPAPAERSYG